MEGHLDRKITREEKEQVAVKPTRSFRYEDYSTRRVFLRSYPLQWDDDEKHGGLSPEDAASADSDSDKNCGDRGWKRQIVVTVVEWGEDKLLLLRRAKKRLALYLLGCHYGRPALPFKSGGGSCTAAMLSST